MAVTVGGGVRSFQFSTGSPEITITGVPEGATITVGIADRSGGMTVSGFSSDVNGTFGTAVEEIVHSTNWRDAMFRRHNCTAGTHVITGTLGVAQNSQLVAFWADSDAGVLQDDGTQFDSVEDLSNDTASASPTLTASAQPGVMVGILETGDNQPAIPTAGTGTLLTTEDEVGQTIFGFALTYTSTGSKQLTATLADASEDRWLVGLYREPSAAAVPKNLLLLGVG